MHVSPTKLRQQRAILSAKAGDPDSPASGTLHARRQRLQADLDRAKTTEAALNDPSPVRHLVVADKTGHSVQQLERMVKQINAEIDAVQQRIEAIDKLLAKNGNRDRD